MDGLIKKGKGENQLEVAIGDGMEFTIHGDLKNKGKKNKLMNNTKVSATINCNYFKPILKIPIRVATSRNPQVKFTFRNLEYLIY